MTPVLAAAGGLQGAPFVLILLANSYHKRLSRPGIGISWIICNNPHLFSSLPQDSQASEFLRPLAFMNSFDIIPYLRPPIKPPRSLNKPKSTIEKGQGGSVLQNTRQIKVRSSLAVSIKEEFSRTTLFER